MITNLRIQNFKSWADTGPMRLAPITGLFGANSSGKTSLLQFLLMLKQTVEATDRARVLNFGDERSLVNLGTFQDVVYQHDLSRAWEFEIEWKFHKDFLLKRTLLREGAIRLEVEVKTAQPAPPAMARLATEAFTYSIGEVKAGMRRKNDAGEYEVHTEGLDLSPIAQAALSPIMAPLRFYGFSDDVYRTYANASLLTLFVTEFEKLMNHVMYLGPLREPPHPTYGWGGERPQDVGRNGQDTVPALLAARSTEVETNVARWLKSMGLIEDFSLRPTAEHSSVYAVKVKKTQNSPEVFITDVGFGVSQILPVLTLCYYVPEGSILILEQPEIHLHPAVQAKLADVLIDVAQTRHIQIILESHSEHLLRRLQRRVAEGEVAAEQMALYFCENHDGASQLTPLQMDEFGNISNWPEEFFGDELGELAAMTLASIKRQKKQSGE